MHGGRCPACGKELNKKPKGIEFKTLNEASEHLNASTKTTKVISVRIPVWMDEAIKRLVENGTFKSGKRAHNKSHNEDARRAQGTLNSPHLHKNNALHLPPFPPSEPPRRGRRGREAPQEHPDKNRRGRQPPGASR
jgi:hypothetical protein